MDSGKIVKIAEKGFGFIKPDKGGSDLFFHVTGLRNRADFDHLKEGDTVQYEVDHSRDRPRAVDVFPPPTV